MIQFLNLDSYKRGLKPVTSTEIFSKPGEFHPEGLFSEIIFGPEESAERKKTFSYINLAAPVIHPTAYMLLLQLDKKIEKFLGTEERFSVTPAGNLIIDPNGVTGLSEFIKLLPKIKFRGGSDTRDKFVKKIEQSSKDGTLFINSIPVIPPLQRNIYQDEKGRWVEDPLNDYYVSLIRRSFQVKSAPKSGPLFDLLNYELQKSVIAHDDFIRKLIQKKRGLIRSQMLGKRTDFSGRAVITPGPNLKVNEIGLPLRLAISIFEPFIFFRLFNLAPAVKTKLEAEVKKFLGLELSSDTIKSLVKSIRGGDKLPKELYDIIFEATEVAMMNRVVIAKRDPVLHAKGVRAFFPKLVEGDTIQICTLQVEGFNADFDGDTMGIFHPITNEAQIEAREKMMKLETGETSNAVSFSISKEMCVGLFIMTKNVKKSQPPIAVTDKDLEKANDPYIPVKYRGQITTMGKAIFNSAFPSSFPYIGSLVTKKVVNSLIPLIIKKYGDEQAIKTFSNLAKMGFKFSTIMSPSITLDDIQLPTSILKLKEKLTGASIEEGDALLKQMQKLLIEHLKGTGLYDLIESGGAKGWGQPMQILVAKGILSDATGKVLDPIKGSFADGLTNSEYFKAASGARKGIVDRVLNTADTGYMSRQLAYVLNSVEIDKQLRDCKTKRHLSLRLTKDLVSRLTGRYIIKGTSVQLFDPNKYNIGDVINLRTPIFCESPKLCHFCYGDLLKRHRSPYAGIIAAQIVGEAGTQTIMRTFHTGGAVKVFQRDILVDIVQNDPLTTKPIVTNKLSQSENQLIAKHDCVLTISPSDYPLPGDLVFNDEKTSVQAKGLVCQAEFSDIIFSIILDYPVDLQIYKMESVKKEFIKLYYDKDSTILEIPRQTEETKEEIRYVKRLLGGREIYKDADHLFLKLFSIYGRLRDMDSVHLEVLLSQALRDKKNPSVPARLGKQWDPTMMDIKKIVFKTSFVQGLAFENINEAIKTGLITEEGGNPSILEKVLTGTLVEKKRR
jgi:DNA-directed RNA polymerase beta' subunit